MNMELENAHTLVEYLKLNGWHTFQDDVYSWNKGNQRTNIDILIWKWD